jgi:hypothetical protein
MKKIIPANADCTVFIRDGVRLVRSGAGNGQRSSRIFVPVRDGVRWAIFAQFHLSRILSGTGDLHSGRVVCAIVEPLCNGYFGVA